MGEFDNEKKKSAYTIEVDNPDGGKFNYDINPMNSAVYYAMQKMIRAGKPFEAFVMVIKSLKVSGDDPDILLNDPKYFGCLIALEEILLSMCEPVNAELKKN